jgi:hypothetical protein
MNHDGLRPIVTDRQYAGHARSVSWPHQYFSLQLAVRAPDAGTAPLHVVTGQDGVGAHGASKQSGDVSHDHRPSALTNFYYFHYKYDLSYYYL